MASLGLGKILVASALIGIMLYFLGGFALEYAPPYANQLNANEIAIAGNFNRTVYDPIVNATESGVKSSVNLSSSSGVIGFALAFILPGLYNVLVVAVQAPILIGQYITVLMYGLPIGGTPGQTALPFIISSIIGIMIMFIAALFLSIWSKYPFWS